MMHLVSVTLNIFTFKIKDSLLCNQSPILAVTLSSVQTPSPYPFSNTPCWAGPCCTGGGGEVCPPHPAKALIPSARPFQQPVHPVSKSKILWALNPHT